jgi:hypothetical protein
MAIDELLAHGGNKFDLKQLRDEFRKATENNKSREPAQIEIAANIPP